MKLDKESFAALIKLLIFLTVAGGATIVLALLLTNGSFADRNQYRAVFSDVTGVVKGDDVRIAGVAVGSVRSVEIVDRDKAIVVFGVNKDTPLTENTNVQIRFRNLVGQRYFALTQGAEGAKATLKPGSAIPESRTEEALDLNVLFNGFKPVFEGLSPEDTNKLSFELVQTFQGEGGTIEQLLGRTSSLTNTLAGRDKLIGDVITNLSEVLDTVGDRDKELTETIDTLQQFATGLKNDREVILGSIDSVSELAVQTADLLEGVRPPLTQDVKQLRRLTAGLSTDRNKKELANALQIVPMKMTKLGNAATYGTYFNFYLCDFEGNLEVPPIPGILPEGTTLQVFGEEGMHVNGGRCD